MTGDAIGVDAARCVECGFAMLPDAEECTNCKATHMPVAKGSQVVEDAGLSREEAVELLTRYLAPFVPPLEALVDYVPPSRYDEVVREMAMALLAPVAAAGEPRPPLVPKRRGKERLDAVDVVQVAQAMPAYFVDAQGVEEVVIQVRIKGRATPDAEDLLRLVAWVVQRRGHVNGWGLLGSVTEAISAAWEDSGVAAVSELQVTVSTPAGQVTREVRLEGAL